MDVDHRLRLSAGVRDRAVLLVVVAEDEPSDLVLHLREDRIALLLREVARCHRAVEQDLDVHLVVRAVDAG